MRNEVILSFCIWNFEDVTHDFITKTIGVEQTKVYVKRQRKNPKFAALANKMVG